ncbi:MAG: hypothetical protein AUI14_12330 [Actinobacteria bacterium 13_2_20CM_2_71_6]|nr:MAG: hypothetical protein AUI14_12330 [Actinobacteria bacterium 13_2_20CM_2_71_6]
MSQLDLAHAAQVSARHVSFLESGRSHPSEDMVLRLMTVLDAPATSRDEALRATGFAPRAPQPPGVPAAVDAALTQMMQRHEPYPLTVLSSGYDIIRNNRGAATVFAAFIAEPARLPARLNPYHLVFDQNLVRPFVVDWAGVACRMIARLHREALQQPADAPVWGLLDRVLTYPDVPAAWRRPDFAVECGTTLEIRLHRGELAVEFLSTVTVFSAPQQAGLDDLRIESLFPLDEDTHAACERLAA